MKAKKSAQRILVIEDNESLSKIIRLKLEEAGYNVLLAGDGEDGLKILKKCLPDLIWLDIYLPVMNGLEFLKKIRQNERTKKLKVVIVSVSGSNKKIETAKKLSVVDYFIKSNYKINELVDEVNKIMLS